MKIIPQRRVGATGRSPYEIRAPRLKPFRDKQPTTMATDVIMPALGVPQEKGTLLNWLKAAGT